jgi:hypothetical protein
MSKLTIFSFVGILAVALWVLPVTAEMALIGDSDLASISGKENSMGCACGNPDVGTDGNIQINAYTWQDNHSADQSDHKGANDQSGDNSQVQQTFVGQLNAITWGAYAAITSTAVTIGGDQLGESWATLYLGGF